MRRDHGSKFRPRGLHLFWFLVPLPKESHLRLQTSSSALPPGHATPPPSTPSRRQFNGHGATYGRRSSAEARPAPIVQSRAMISLRPHPWRGFPGWTIDQALPFAPASASDLARPSSLEGIAPSRRVTFASHQLSRLGSCTVAPGYLPLHLTIPPSPALPALSAPPSPQPAASRWLNRPHCGRQISADDPCYHASDGRRRRLSHDMERAHSPRSAFLGSSAQTVRTDSTTLVPLCLFLTTRLTWSRPAAPRHWLARGAGSGPDPPDSSAPIRLQPFSRPLSRKPSHRDGLCTCYIRAMAFPYVCLAAATSTSIPCPCIRETSTFRPCHTRPSCSAPGRPDRT